jgi:hypothetical protein
MDTVLTKNTYSADLSAPFGLKHEAQCSTAGAEMSETYRLIVSNCLVLGWVQSACLNIWQGVLENRRNFSYLLLPKIPQDPRYTTVNTNGCGTWSLFLVERYEAELYEIRQRFLSLQVLHFWVTVPCDSERDTGAFCSHLQVWNI